MNTDKVNALWVKASDDAEGMRLGYTMQHHYFAALIQREMEADGWRQCAVGQGTTQFCGVAEELRKDAKQEWVGLTDEEIKDIVGRNDPGGIGRYTRDLFKKIEAKLKEKNE